MAVNRWFPPDRSDALAWSPVRMGGQMLLDLRSGTENRAYYTGEYDTAAIRSVLRLVGPDWVVLDVGANIGFWTVPLAKALRGGGRLHAFEPVPANFARLVQNVERNEVSLVAQVHQFGLSDAEGVAQISLREDFARGAGTGNAAIVIDSEDLRFECVDIRVFRLDDIFESLKVHRLDFIKVDIEGHEDKFLAGGAEVIRRFRPIIYIEINEPYYERRGVDVTALFENWLHSFSYSVGLRTRHGWRLGAIRERRQVLDDVFFFPSEVGEDCVNRLSAKAGEAGSAA
jgi:FkbM family methyltransferase